MAGNRRLVSLTGVDDGSLVMDELCDEAVEGVLSLPISTSVLLPEISNLLDSLV